MQIVTLLPSSVSYGHALAPFGGGVNTTVVDLPVEFGGGSVTDDSDTSWVQIGTWAEPDGDGRIDHVEPLSATFVLPSAYRDPTAVALNMRIRSDPDALVPPPDFFPSGVSLSLVAAGDDESLGAVAASNSNPFFIEVVTAEVPLGERSFWFGEIDPLIPTDLGGNWFEFAVSADVPAEDCVAALTGAGIRATIAIYSGVPLDNDSPSRRPWLDVYQFQMLVACELAGGPRDRRKYPNPTGYGLGTRRHWPPPRRGITGIN